VPGPLLSIFLIVLVDIFGLTLVIPLQAIYAEKLSATPLQATLLVSIFALCQLVAAPILGRLSDRFGRKRLLVLSQLGTCLGFAIMASAHSLWMLYLARALDGATAGNLSLAQAYIADTTAPENRTRSFALIGIAFGLGFFIGPVATAWLVRYGYTAPIWAAVGLSALSILGTLVLLPGGPPPVTRATVGPAGQRPSIFAVGIYREVFARPDLRRLLLQFFAYIFSFSVFTSGFALFAERRFRYEGVPFGPREIGFLFAYSGFLGIVLQGGLIGRLVRRFGEAALSRAAFVALLVTYAGLALATNIPLLMVVTTIAAFGNGVARPTLTGLISRAAGAEEQGTVLGVTQSLSSLAMIIAPALAGSLLGLGWLSAWSGLAGLAVVGALLLHAWMPAHQPTPVEGT
jgi:MFS transporter, DHA1 family, tetracycline resistance protein